MNLRKPASRAGSLPDITAYSLGEDSAKEISPISTRVDWRLRTRLKWTPVFRPLSAVAKVDPAHCC